MNRIDRRLVKSSIYSFNRIEDFQWIEAKYQIIMSYLENNLQSIYKSERVSQCSGWSSVGSHEKKGHMSESSLRLNSVTTVSPALWYIMSATKKLSVFLCLWLQYGYWRVSPLLGSPDAMVHTVQEVCCFLCVCYHNVLWFIRILKNKIKFSWVVSVLLWGTKSFIIGDICMKIRNYWTFVYWTEGFF